VAKEEKAEPVQKPEAVSAVSPAAVVSPASAASAHCSTCGQPNPPTGVQASIVGFGQGVYGVGQLTVHTTSMGAERQLAQLTGGAHQGDQVEVGMLQEVLSRRENTWLGWELAWLFSSGHVPAFSVMPQYAEQVMQLAELLRPPEDEAVNVIVGKTVPTPADSPSAAVGLPTVRPYRMMAFTLQEFARGMPQDEAASAEKSAAAGRKTERTEFEATVRDVFYRLTNGAAVAGFTHEQQACAYVGTEFSLFYSAIRREQLEGKRLTRVYARHSHSADRLIVAVGFVVRDPRTDMTDGWECLADVTDAGMPFLVTGLRRVYA
jgi:PatG C-terminal